jgi:hypothetical protein
VFVLSWTKRRQHKEKKTLLNLTLAMKESRHAPDLEVETLFYDVRMGERRENVSKMDFSPFSLFLSEMLIT